MRFVDCNPQASYVSKAAGRSAAAKFDYVTRGGRYDRLSDPAVAYRTLGLPAFAASDPRSYWVAADAFERKNGATLYEYILPLPANLSVAHQIRLCEMFARGFMRKFRDGKPVVTWALHEGYGANPHMHFCFGTRLIDDHTSHLKPKLFFKRHDGSRQGGAKRFGTQQNSRWFLDSVKRIWRYYANYIARKAGLLVTFVGGALELQRKRARRLIAFAKAEGKKDLYAAAYWWWVKCHRPVTHHLGQWAAKGSSNAAVESRSRYSTEKNVRDQFLMEAAASVEVALIKRDLPVPGECSDLAERWRTYRPALFPELSADVPVKPHVPRAESQSGPTEKTNHGAAFGRIATVPLDAEFIKRGITKEFEPAQWRRYYKRNISPVLIPSIAFFDQQAGIFRCASGDYIYDSGTELRATRLNRVTVPILIEQAKAKGWVRVGINEGDAAVLAAFLSAGIAAESLPQWTIEHQATDNSLDTRPAEETEVAFPKS